MTKHMRSFTSLLVAMSLASCFQQETTIHLKKDGSGTIIEQAQLGEQMLAMPAENLKELFVQAEQKAKQRATKLGEGVNFVKFEQSGEGTPKGWRTTYQFADINNLRLSKEIRMESPDEEPVEIAEDDLLVFKYNDGVLSIRPNMDKQDDKAAAQQGEEMPAEAIAQMQMMLGEMKYSIRLVAETGISETNATHRKDNTITLLEVDMQEVMKKPENLKKMGGLDQGDHSAALESLKGSDGVKMETKPEITVKLK